MALSWKLLNYQTGMVIRSEGLPVSDESAEVSLDIHGEDSAEIDIIRDQLTAAENNSWKNTFALLLKGVALDDDSKPWNDPTAISFSGFINKLNDDISPQKIKAQITGLTEYTKGRIVADTWSPVSDPTTTVDFTGSTDAELMASAFIKCFSAVGIPAGKPKPYGILGKIQTPDGTLIVPSGTTLKKSVKVTDAMTYHDLLTSVSEAGGGLEWRVVTRWIDSTRQQVVCDIIIGTAVTPHINENVSLNLDLAENEAKFSSYHGTFDSNELYSKLYIQSVAGDETAKNGADFTVASVDDTEFPVLFERFFNPGVALTSAELNAQLSARLSFAAKPKYETGFTVEEKSDPSEWIAHLGKKLILTGVANTPSAGHDATVRIVGISFTPDKGTVKAELMQLGPTYPRLPKDRLQGLTGAYSGNSMPVPSTGGGVTPTPVPTIPGGFGVDGVMPNTSLWGDQGRNPWDIMPKQWANAEFTDYKDISYEIATFNGRSPIAAETMVQDEGNRIYGLDHRDQGFGSVFSSSAVQNWGGGIDADTGEPLIGFYPYYIKKTYMVDGTLGEVKEVGQITVAKLRTMISGWNDNAFGKDNANYERGIGASNWVVGGRYYFCLGDIWRRRGDSSSSWTSDTTQSLTRVKIISIGIDGATGELVGDWRDELTPTNYCFPGSQSMARYGTNVIFGQTIACDGFYYDHYTSSQINALQAAVHSSSGVYPISQYQFGPFSGSGELYGKPGWNPPFQYDLGAVIKDYAKPELPFQLFKGFNSTTTGYGAPRFYGFSGDGQLFGADEYGQIGAIPVDAGGGNPRGTWTRYTTPTPSDSIAAINGFLFFSTTTQAGQGAAGGRVAKISGAGLGAITVLEAPYKDFSFEQGGQGLLSILGQYQYFDMGHGTSRIFSYDGRLYNFKIIANSSGVKNTIQLHSMLIKEKPAAAPAP